MDEKAERIEHMADVRPTTVVGVFSNRSKADETVTALQKAGFQSDQIRYSSERKPQGEVIRDLADMGVAPEDISFYQKECEIGHPLVSVTSSKRLQDATSILLSHGAYGPERKATASTLNETGTMTERRGKASTSRAREEHPHLEQEQHMRLHAEQLRAYKQPHQVGEVILRKEVVSEQQGIDVPITREEVVIERRTLAEDASAAEEAIGEKQTIRIPITDEEVMVSKQNVTIGEVVIGKHELHETRHFTDTVRHEEARLEREGDVPIWDMSPDHPLWDKNTDRPSQSSPGS